MLLRSCTVTLHFTVLNAAAQLQSNLAAETREQRQARLHHGSQHPLFEQPCVQTKMAKFHAHMSTLDISTCTTCSEGFPGLQLCSSTSECLQCSRDLMYRVKLRWKNVDISSATYHVTVSASSWAVWLQRTCHQPASIYFFLYACISQARPQDV